MRRFFRIVSFALLTCGCDKVVGMAHADEEPAKAAVATPAPSSSARATAVSAGPESTEPGTRYGVPFGWEVSKDEPLFKARAYLGDLVKASGENVALGKNHFMPFAEEQTPRATVVTCADSRVQSSAWDSTPENDAFTIRNIGNQVEMAHGSVEYGLEYLHTPVLLILGHTGCGAVKAAMGKLDDLEPPLKHELAGIKLPPSDPKATERQAWAQAVVANVNRQVDFAVTHFGKLLREQRVLVVGAVYDFRNDLGHGYGSVRFVNVNGNTEAARLRAFEVALKPLSPDEPDAEPLGLSRGASGESTLAALIRRQAGGPHAPQDEQAAHDDHKPRREPDAHHDADQPAAAHGVAARD